MIRSKLWRWQINRNMTNRGRQGHIIAQPKELAIVQTRLMQFGILISRHYTSWASVLVEMRFVNTERT